MSRKTTADDYSWEKQDAPRVSSGAWRGVVTLFVLWVAFLAAMSVHRWVFTLQ